MTNLAETQASSALDSICNELSGENKRLVQIIETLEKHGHKAIDTNVPIDASQKEPSNSVGLIPSIASEVVLFKELNQRLSSFERKLASII